MKMTHGVVAILSASALGLAACTGPAEGEGSAVAEQKPVSEDAIVIGIPVGLTGSNSTIAPSIVQASQVAINEINESGGLLGREVAMRVYDDQSGAEGAVKAFTKAILDDGVTGIVGMETSAARNAGQPIAARENVPYIYTSNYEGGACAPNLFIPAPVPIQVSEPAIDYVQEQMDAETWFLVGSDYAYGRGAVNFFSELLTDKGYEVVGTEFNPIDAPDWTSVLQSIRAAEPDAVVSAFAAGAPHVTFFQQWHEGGFDIPHVSLTVDEQTAKDLGETVEGLLYPSPYFTELDNDGNDALLAALEDEFGEEAQLPNYLSVPQYNGVRLLGNAIEQAGSTDSEAIIEALSQVEFEGPSGRVAVDKQHHAALNIWMGEVRPDGTTAVVHDFGLIEPGDQCPGLN
ncbi:substrate-binding protein [Georgenia subflava]|uniref:ABC transporter substrate-binding protein n=1 Tax=Georgenia subflava TaxID=1622177 RepID=A0A6N7EJ02_9MICO|nr:substrate-binding protein [Georgenia subflava]MPV38362.1 ABC transporter substrate-binding protein [Georgenia subflava]